MAFGVFKVLKGLLIKEENSLNPKQVQITPGGTAGTTVTIQGNQTADQTLNLPAGSGTDTLTANAASQTLTNKTLTAPTINTGVISGTFSSNSTPNASSGSIKLPNKATNVANSKIAWRDVANTDDIFLSVPSGNVLQIGNNTNTYGFVSPSGLFLKDKDSASPAYIENGIDSSKKVQFDTSNITTSTTRQVIFPDSDITVVGTSNAQTLSSKTLNNTNIITVQDSNLTIQDNSDNTKQLKFEASGITTGTTRTLTVPNANTTIVGTDVAQTLSNKTFSDAPVLAEIATPSTPASGFGKIYFKSDGFLYQLNDDGTETKVGAGSGGINYITNSDAESNTTGWTVSKNTSAGSKPDNGFVTSGTNITWTRVTSSPSPLRGTASFLLTKDAANRQGQQVYSDFTIANANKAGVLNVSFEYSIYSGTYATGDLIVYLYDGTNFIEPAPRDIENATINTRWSGSFQTSASATSYKLIFHVATTNAVGYAVQFDNIQVGPAAIMGVIPKASTITKYTSGSGTYTTPAGVKYLHIKMVGGGGGGGGSTVGGATTSGSNGVDTTFGSYTASKGIGASTGTSTAGSGGSGGDLYIGSSVTAGAGSSGTYDGGSPGSGTPFGSGGSGGIAAVAGNAAASNTGGGGGGGGGSTGGAFGGGGTGGGYLEVIINNPATSYSYAVGAGGSGGAAGTGGWAGGAGGSGVIEITEYYIGTNTLMSDQTDTRVVRTQVNNGTGSAQAISATTFTKVTFNTTIKDSHGTYDPTTNYRYTVPVAGTYAHSGAIHCGDQASNTHTQVFLYKNGSAIKSSATNQAGTAAGGVPFHFEVDAVAGDYFEIYFWSFLAINVYTGAAVSGGSTWNIHRIAGPNQIASSEVVCYTARNQSISAITSSGDVAKFATSHVNTHSDTYDSSTGRYTFPIAGYYTLSAIIATVVSNPQNDSYVQVYFRKNSTGSGLNSAVHNYAPGHTGSVYSYLSMTLSDNFNAGDYIDIPIVWNTTNAQAATNALGGSSFSVIKQGK